MKHRIFGIVFGVLGAVGSAVAAPYTLLDETLAKASATDLTYLFPNPPAPVSSMWTITFSGRGDFFAREVGELLAGLPEEDLTVEVEGIFFKMGPVDTKTSFGPDDVLWSRTFQLPVPAADVGIDDLLADGRIDISFDPSPSIDDYAPDTSFVRFTLTYQIESDSTAVPAPATLALLGLSLVGLGWSRRKR